MATDTAPHEGAPAPDGGAAPAVRPRTTAPRVTWLTLHVFGLGLLWLAGGWPALTEKEAILYAALALTVLLYSASSFLDPGYMPIGPDEFVAESAQPALHEALLDTPRCVHCQARQPPRTKHCHDCGRCVRRMDHHCWWLGNCVGYNNHRLFIGYLAAQTTLLGWAAWLAAAAFGSPSAARAAPVAGVSSGAAAVCVGFCAILGVLSLTLLVFQLMLVLRGETTWEHLRRERINFAESLPANHRPYDNGPLPNVLSFCCGCKPAVRRVPVVAPGAAPPLTIPTAVPVTGPRDGVQVVVASGVPIDGAPHRVPLSTDDWPDDAADVDDEEWADAHEPSDEGSPRTSERSPRTSERLSR